MGVTPPAATRTMDAAHALPRPANALVWVLVAALGLGLLMGWATPAQAQEVDRRSEKWYERGVELFVLGDYRRAAATFEDIADRTPNRVTAASIYMAALSLYYAREYEPAIRKFEYFLRYYGHTKYKDETNYHKALMMLDRGGNDAGALWLLMNLAEQSDVPGLREDAHQVVQNFMFSRTDAAFLRGYLKMVRASYEQLTYEALAYHLYQDQAYDSLKQLLAEANAAGYGSSTRLAVFEPLLAQARQNAQQRQEVFQRPLSDTLRLAVVLPFESIVYDSNEVAVPSTSCDFWAGAQLAIDSFRYPTPVPVRLEVFSTGNSQEPNMGSVIYNDLNRYDPHVVVGGRSVHTAIQLANHCESRRAICLIPFATDPSLVQGKRFTYLANAGLDWQATTLAEAAIQTLGARTIYTLADQTRASQTAQAAFCQRAESLGRHCHRAQVPPGDRSKALKYVERFVDDMQKGFGTAIYFPSMEEDLVTVLLEKLSMLEPHELPAVIGLAEWQTFQYINPELFYRMEPVVYEPYNPTPTGPDYQAFRRMYRNRYKINPNLYAQQGFDLMHYLLQQGQVWWTTHQPEALFKQGKVVEGINQAYNYHLGQSNQARQLYRLEEGQLVPLRGGF